MLLHVTQTVINSPIRKLTEKPPVYRVILQEDIVLG